MAVTLLGRRNGTSTKERVSPPAVKELPNYPTPFESPKPKTGFTRIEEGPLPFYETPREVLIMLQTYRKDLVVELPAVPLTQRLKERITSLVRRDSKGNSRAWKFPGGEPLEDEPPLEAARRNLSLAFGEFASQIEEHSGIKPYGYIRDYENEKNSRQFVLARADIPTVSALLKTGRFMLLTQKRIAQEMKVPSPYRPALEAYQKYTCDPGFVLMTGPFPTGEGTN